MLLILFLSILITLLLISRRKNFIQYWKKACFYFLGLIFIGLAFWTHQYIGTTDLQALLSTILIETEGLLHTSFILIQSFFIEVLVVPIIIMTTLVSIDSYLEKRQIPFFYRSFFSKFLGSLLIIIGLCWLNNLYKLAEGVLDIAFGFNYHGEDTFAKAYKDPAQQKFVVSSKPKSLIFIYIESLDLAYDDKKMFNKNLLKSLEEIPHTSFQNFVQTNGADYTIAGMIASQCGIPLNLIPMLSQNSINDLVNNFLTNAVCLGDILHQAGYYNVFMKGASLSFAGTGNFYKVHHYDQIIGKEEWLFKKKYTYNDMLGWGLPDNLLFKEAKLKLTELIQTKKPFNLTLLTIDTHGPYGQINKSCRSKGARVFEDVITCISDEVADFLNFIAQKGWTDQLTIVVMGDHLSILNPVINKLTKNNPRYIFNMIIEGSLPEKQRELIAHEDIFPTLLNALNISWGKAHLALGYSGFQPLPKNFSSKRHIEKINQIAAQPSAKYKSLWFP